MVEAYHNMYNSGVLEYLRVFKKEDKRVNIIYQWRIIFFSVCFEIMELCAIEKWEKLITEGPDTAHFPIKNPLIKIPTTKRFT